MDIINYQNKKGYIIKTLYLIRHAKSDWSEVKIADFERGVKKRGIKDINTMGSYLSLRKINPDLILSSCALRAQISVNKLVEKIEYKGSITFMEEIYLSRPKILMDIVSLQDDSYSSIFLVGHNPELTEFANILIEDNFFKMPTMGILAINFDIENWSEILETKGKIDFFIHPKQFRYYVPNQISATLGG